MQVTLRNSNQVYVHVPPANEITYILLRVDGHKQFRYNGLPPNVIALPRKTKSSREKNLKFHQFPVRPRFAMTVHVCQGQTLNNGVIVDCPCASRLAYVATSRAKNLDDVAFLMKFDANQHQSKCVPPERLTNALKKLKQLHDRTVKAVDSVIRTQHT